jgi:predicted phosphate transport protein (TIGR00153 family)
LKLLLSDVLPRELIDLLRNYAEVVKNAASDFTRAVTLLNDMRIGESRSLLADVIRLLDKSGEIKTNIEEGVANTSTDPGFKEEVLLLINMLDEISDSIKETARELTILPFLELPEKLRKGLIELAYTASNSISILAESFTSFILGEYSKLDENFKEVIKLEEKADELQLKNRGLMLDFSDAIRPYAMQLLVYSLSEMLEIITDLAARTASRIRLIVKAWLS